MVGSFFYGSLLGVFVLAFGPWRANGNGASFGMLAGLAAIAWVSQTTGISFLWYNVVGCLVAVGAGLAVSQIAGTDQQRTSAQVSPANSLPQSLFPPVFLLASRVQ